MAGPMHGRPHAATLTVRCFHAGCDCTRTIGGQVTESSEKGQLVEREYEKDCALCGHKAINHGMVKLEKGTAIERRRTPRH